MHKTRPRGLTYKSTEESFNMQHKIWSTVLLAAVITSFAVPAALADSPVNITEPDRHSVEAKGNIGLYRMQVEGMNLGQGNNQARAELFVTLTSNPDTVYSLHVSNDSTTNRVIADTLRDAYINKLPVTLYYQMPIKRSNNFKILMVQLDR